MTHDEATVERVARALAEEMDLDDDDYYARKLARAALSAMPEAALLREALEALSPMTRGLKEADYYCPDDVAEDHTVLISASIAELREARAAADKIRAALGGE